MNEKSVRTFGIRDKIGYLMGDVGNDFTFIFASMYVMVFYTKVMGVSSGLVGTMFLIARCVDAFTDIGMGRIVDSAKKQKDGRFRPWIRRMCGPVALSSFLIYQSGLAGAPMALKIAYMFVTYILWGSVFYTSINIPYGSMASVISNEPKDRSSLSVFRSLGAGFASVIISVIAPLVVYYTDADGNQVVSGARMTLIAGIFSVCALLSYLICYAWSIERVEITQKQETSHMSVVQSLSEIFASRALLGVILSALLMLFASLMGQGINNYLFADYFRNTKMLSVYSMLSFPAMIVLALVSTRLATRFGKKECGAVGMLFSGILYIVLGILHIENVVVFVVLAFLALLGMYFFNMQSYALVTDVIDDKEVHTGTRDDGTIYGIYSFARKIGQAVAGGLSGWALGWIGYDELAVRQSAEVATGIYNLATYFPGVIYLLCGLVLAFVYPLGKQTVESNVAKLEKRHEMSKNGGAI